MANIFDMANSPEGEPVEIVAGDFVQWRRSDFIEDYPSASYTVTYVARIAGESDAEIKIVATGQTDYYLATVSSATSSGFSAGDYHWQLEVLQDSSDNRIILDTGYFSVVPDLDTNQADPRTHAEITLDKIEALIEGKADNDALEYSVAGRSLKKYSFNELVELREYYRREVSKYKAERDMKQGRGSHATVKVRF